MEMMVEHLMEVVVVEHLHQEVLLVEKEMELETMVVMEQLVAVQVMGLVEAVVLVVLVLMDPLLDKQQLLEVPEHQIVLWDLITSGQAVAVASTLVVMEEQVAPVVAVVVDVKILTLVVLAALVDYLMAKMDKKHHHLTLEITKVDTVEIAPEAVVAVVALQETLMSTQGVVMVVPVL
jgi:hypothetical protein